MLTKQLEDEKSLRLQMNEQLNDIQRQLKNEREEHKKSKKRLSIIVILNTFDCDFCLSYLESNC